LGIGPRYQASFDLENGEITKISADKNWARVKRGDNCSMDIPILKHKKWPKVTVPHGYNGKAKKTIMRVKTGPKWG
jgi:hypothetical protein